MGDAGQTVDRKCRRADRGLETITPHTWANLGAILILTGAVHLLILARKSTI